MRTTMENVIADIWSNISGVDEYPEDPTSDGSDDTHERIQKFSAALGDVFDIEITSHEITCRSTFGELSDHLTERRDASQSGAYDTDDQTPEEFDLAAGSPLPATPGQVGLWYVDQSSSDPAIYHCPFELRPDFTVDVALIERGLRNAIARHEALRTTFELADGRLVQRISDHPQVDFSVERCANEEQYRAVRRRILDEPFDLAVGPLVRVAVVTDPHGALRVIGNVHHIVVDATSVSLFLEAWFSEYVRLQGGDVTPRSSGRQYRDFVTWQRGLLAAIPLT